MQRYEGASTIFGPRTCKGRVLCLRPLTRHLSRHAGRIHPRIRQTRSVPLTKCDGQASFGPCPRRSHRRGHLTPGEYSSGRISGRPLGNTPADCGLQLPVIQDTAPLGKNFGDVLIDVAVESPYRAGDTVVAQFVGCVRICSAPRLTTDLNRLQLDDTGPTQGCALRANCCRTMLFTHSSPIIHFRTTYVWSKRSSPLTDGPTSNGSR